MEKMKCKHDRVKEAVDIERIRDGKIFEDVTAELCEECEAYFINVKEIGEDE